MMGLILRETNNKGLAFVVKTEKDGAEDRFVLAGFWITRRLFER